MRGSVHRFLGVVGLLAGLALGSLGGAAESPAASACIPPEDGPSVCLRVSHTTDGASVSTQESSRYVSFDASVTNEGGSVVTHVTLEIAPVLPAVGAGFSLVSEPRPSSGSCSYAPASRTLTCELGRLRSGASADVDVLLRTPTTPGTTPLEFETSVDEGPKDENPNPGKVDTVTVTEAVEVSADESRAATYVPRNTGLELVVTQDGRRDALSLPPQAFATTAELEFTSTADLPFTCPEGLVCRIGTPWLTATIPGSFDPLAEFDFFWPASQVSSRQTARNFVLYYLAFPGAELEIVSARCDEPPAVVPCLKNISLPKSGPLKGTLSATLVTDHNGNMR